VFLVIVLILFGFSGLWVQPLRKATILLSGKAPQPAKYLAAKAGNLQMGLLRVELASIRFAEVRSAIANGFRAVANVADYVAAMAKPISRDFGSGKAVSETLQSRYFGNRELSSDTKSIMRDFGDLIKCTVTVITVIVIRRNPHG
jgi:hypothetical protein